MAAYDNDWYTEFSKWMKFYWVSLKKTNQAEKDGFITFILKRNNYRKSFL